MALDANINRIKFLRTKTAGSVPAASLLDEGEIAINLADRTIYSKNGANVVELGFGKGGNVSGAITAPQFNGPLVGNASTATKLQTTRTISLTGSATGSISFDGTSNQSISVNVNRLDALSMYSKSNSDLPTNWGSGIQTSFVSSTQGWPLPYGGVITARPYDGNGGGTLQILTAYGSTSGVGNGEILIRTGDYSGLNNNSWTSWKTLVHSENVNNYSPTKTGVGASGDWGISITGNSATATKLQTPRTISLMGDGAGSASFDGSANTSINLTLNDVNNSAGTYGANHLEIPTFTLNKKGLLISAGNRAFPYSGVGQYGAAILYNGLDSYSTSHSATANIVRHLNDVKVDVKKSFNDAFGSDVDHYITYADRKGFTSCADLPVGSRVLLDSIVPFTDLPNMNDGNVYIETKRTYIHPGKLQIAYGYNNGSIATRAAGTGGPYSEWRYMASLDSNVASATKLQTARTINGVSFDGTSNITIADNTKLPLTGGTISGQLVAPNIMINHSSKAASGISWYSSSYNSWQDYMAQAGSTGNGVYGNITAPTGTYVTTWARRSVIEPAAGYGWTFETMTMNGTAPSIVAELSINGTFKTAGDIHGANLTVSGNINATQFSSASPYSFLNGGAAQNIMTGGVLVSNSYADITKVPTNGIYAKGIIRSDAGFKGKLLAADSRIFKPYHAENGGISAYFVTEWGLNNDYVGGNYGDFLSLNTYHDASAGMQNGLFFDKAGKRIVHYQSGWGGTNWDGGKTLAYAEDVLSLNGGTMNAPINFTLSHADGAFHKLIEGTTVTDGGYIAVGNHGSDKGYLELGTVDDPDAAIYARKRNAANTVLEEAVILGPDGNTSFPHSVLIHNAPGVYGKSGLVKGNADNAAYTGCNIDITSWFGVGITSSNTGERTVVFNSRTGDISNKGSINAQWFVQANKGIGISSTAGLGHGLSLYNGAMDGLPHYGIAFAQTYHHGQHGYVDGDWATYFTMEGAWNRGWIFRSHTHGNVASINSVGNAYFNGSITASTFNGNATSANRLSANPSINGVTFNGTAHIEVPTLGYGQYWQNVIGSRASGVNYTNTTGKPIFVVVNISGGTSFVDNVELRVRGTDAEGDWSFIVPNGAIYRCTGTIRSWVELR